MAILTDGHVENCLRGDIIRCLSTLESVRTTYTYSLGGGDDARHLTHATHAQGGHHHPDRTCDAFVGLKILKPEKSSCTKSLARLNCTALWLPPPLVAATANKNRTFPQKAACCVEMDSNSRATSARPRMGLLMGAGSARSRLTRQGQVGARRPHVCHWNLMRRKLLQWVVQYVCIQATFSLPPSDM